jgi:signal transduction histidine kinase
MSIAKKLLIIMLLVAGVSVAAIAMLTLKSATDALHDLEGKRVADSVEREARILQTAIDMVKSDLTMLADGGARHVMEEHAEPSVDSLQRVADQLNILMRERHAYRQAKMLLVTEVGTPRVLVSTRIDNVVRTAVDPAVADWNFAALLAEKQGLRNFNEKTGVVSKEASGEKVLFISLPIRGKDRDVIGAIAMMVAIDQVFRTFGGGHDGISYWVADSTGNYLFQSRPQASIGYSHQTANAIRDFKLEDAWDRLLLGDQPQLVVELPGISTLLSVRRASLDTGDGEDPRNTLIVGGTAPLLDLESRAAALQRQLSMIVIGVGLLMVVTLVIATNRLLRPIDELTKVANHIASGDRSVVIPTSSDDEIGILARAMMRMADELRAAGKNSEQSAMGQMALMIAHDLRNALSAVKMNLQILDSHHRQEGDGQTESCEIALGQVRYMEIILNDMLTFARPGSAEFDWVDLGDTLRTASVSLLAETTQKSIDLRMEGEEKLPTVMADRNKLFQLFQNILGNAVHAVPEWGHITIRTRCLLHESQPAVEVRIEDDGPGISPQNADKVFEPFFTTSARGTGLGLAIVRRIVDQHGGRVYLDATVTQGTTLIVLLPLTQGAQDAQGTLKQTSVS